MTPWRRVLPDEITRAQLLKKFPAFYVKRRQTAQKTEVESFNLKKLSEVEVRKQFQIELSNRFIALEDLKTIPRT
jgi:hypothetical protein